MIIDKDNYIYLKEFNDENIGSLFTKKPFDFSINKEEQYNELNNILDKDLIYKECHQTHSNNVCVIDKDNMTKDIDNCDGMITNLKNVALVIKVADCQSILLYDPINKVIGNIHSGWRGTLNTIILNALDIMLKSFNSKLENIKVFIGPSIEKCCFEVDEDVMLLLKNKFSIKNIKFKNKKYFIDTVNINKELLIEHGIKKDNIILSNICTKCNGDIYHSYRKDKDLSGRNASIVYLK